MSTLVLIMRTDMSPLGVLLFGQTRGRILAYLFGKPEEASFIRQIAREVGTSVGAVQRELTNLSKLQLIERSVDGKQVYYRANKSHRIFAELHSLVAKTSGIYYRLRSALEPIASEISFAFVYGSMASGEENSESDIDLMVIGEVTLDEILMRLTPAERSLGRPINPAVFSLAEFRSKLKGRNHFLKSVLRGKKVMLIGDEDELEPMG